MYLCRKESRKNVSLQLSLGFFFQSHPLLLPTALQAVMFSDTSVIAVPFTRSHIHILALTLTSCSLNHCFFIYVTGSTSLMNHLLLKCSNCSRSSVWSAESVKLLKIKLSKTLNEELVQQRLLFLIIVFRHKYRSRIHNPVTQIKSFSKCSESQRSQGLTELRGEQSKGQKQARSGPRKQAGRQQDNPQSSVTRVQTETGRAEQTRKNRWKAA